MVDRDGARPELLCNFPSLFFVFDFFFVFLFFLFFFSSSSFPPFFLFGARTPLRGLEGRVAAWQSLTSGPLSPRGSIPAVVFVNLIQLTTLST